MYSLPPAFLPTFTSHSYCHLFSFSYFHSYSSSPYSHSYVSGVSLRHFNQARVPVQSFLSRPAFKLGFFQPPKPLLRAIWPCGRSSSASAALPPEPQSRTVHLMCIDIDPQIAQYLFPNSDSGTTPPRSHPSPPPFDLHADEGNHYDSSSSTFSSTTVSGSPSPHSIGSRLLQKTITVVATAEETSRIHDRVVARFARQGEFPATVLNTVCDEVVAAAMKRTLKEEKVEAVGVVRMKERPFQLVQKLEPGKELEFTIVVDVYEELRLREGYMEMEVQVKEDEKQGENETDEDAMVDETILEFRQTYATYEPLSPPDYRIDTLDPQLLCTISIHGALVPSPAQKPLAHPRENSVASDPQQQQQQYRISLDSLQVRLETGQFAQGLIEGLRGMHVGQAKQIRIRFPDTAANTQIRGQVADVVVTLEQVQREILAQEDQELVRRVVLDLQEAEHEEGSGYKQQVHAQQPVMTTIQELREWVRSKLRRERQRRWEVTVDRALEDHLISDYVYGEVPEVLFKHRLQHKFSLVMRSVQKELELTEPQYDALLNTKNYDSFKGHSREATLKEIKTIFAIEEIAKRHSIEVDPDEVDMQLELMRVTWRDAATEWNEHYMRQELESTLLREAVLAKLREKATIRTVPASTLAETPSNGTGTI